MPDSGLSWGFHRPPSDLARQCHEAQRPGHFGVSAHSSSHTGANASLANAGSAQVVARFTDEHDSLARDADIERAPSTATVSAGAIKCTSIVLSPGAMGCNEPPPSWGDHRCCQPNMP
jgi:hypothetical protein